MSKPKVFGKFCGLECEGLNKTGITYCTIYTPYENAVSPLVQDLATNQIERCPQCLAKYPVEVE